MKILLGSTFPLTLISRPIKIIPLNLEFFNDFIKGKQIYSFREHANTMQAAEDIRHSGSGKITEKVYSSDKLLFNNRAFGAMLYTKKSI